MNLQFIKQFPDGTPTYFIEKIWAGFALNDFLWENRNGCWSTESFKEQFPYNYDWLSVFLECRTPKIHTIREDVKQKWYPGKMIHFQQWQGKPYNSKCYQFAPVIPCFSIQKIEIKHVNFGGYDVFIDDKHFHYQPSFQIDDWDCQSTNRMLNLVQNDGFSSIAEFFRYFEKDFSGKIIHWTNLKY
jgi:hypothetical protein